MCLKFVCNDLLKVPVMKIPEMAHIQMMLVSLLHTTLLPISASLEIVVWIYYTNDNNLKIKIESLKYLNKS